MTPPHALPPDADDWLADFPDTNRADLETPWRLAEGADPLRQAPVPDPERIAHIREALVQATRTPSRRPVLRRAVPPARHTRRWLAAAACVALLVATGIFFRMDRPLTVTAPRGGITAVDLPDGSRIELNAGSSIVYPRRFAETRRVRLDGEAFFDVAREEVPFVIETFNADITVRGTSFNVRAWPSPDDAQTVVAVVTGVVEVASRSAPGRRVALRPGETTRVIASAPEPTQPAPGASDDGATSWRSGGFYFVDQSYGAIFDEVERRFNVRITASSSIRSRRRTFTKQQAVDARAFLDDFCASVGLRYRPTAGGFEVFAE